MFQPFKRNISFILYNNSTELNILFKNCKNENRIKTKESLFIYLASKQNNDQILIP